MRGTGKVHLSVKDGELIGIMMDPGFHSEQENHYAVMKMNRNLGCDHASNVLHIQGNAAMREYELSDGSHATVVYAGSISGSTAQAYLDHLAKVEDFPRRLELKMSEPVSAAWGEDGLMVSFTGEARQYAEQFLKKLEEGRIRSDFTDLLFADHRDYMPGLCLVDDQAYRQMYQEQGITASDEHPSIEPFKKNFLDLGGPMNNYAMSRLGILFGADIDDGSGNSRVNPGVIIPEMKYRDDITGHDRRSYGGSGRDEILSTAEKHGFKYVCGSDYQTGNEYPQDLLMNEKGDLLMLSHTGNHCIICERDGAAEMEYKDATAIKFPDGDHSLAVIEPGDGLFEAYEEYLKTDAGRLDTPEVRRFLPAMGTPEVRLSFGFRQTEAQRIAPVIRAADFFDSYELSEKGIKLPDDGRAVFIEDDYRHPLKALYEAGNGLLYVSDPCFHDTVWEHEPKFPDGIDRDLYMNEIANASGLTREEVCMQYNFLERGNGSQQDRLLPLDDMLKEIMEDGLGQPDEKLIRLSASDKADDITL